MNTNTQKNRSVLNKGKWSSSEVPKRGWVCIATDDLGEPQAECEMCESQTIRYVHYMRHSDYSKVLEVGCICAGYMEENSGAAEDREATLKKQVSGRKRWISTSWKNDLYGIVKKTGYFRVTVAQRDQGWTIEIHTLIAALVHRPENTIFKTVDEAQLYGFDYLSNYHAAVFDSERIR